jgi:hypothetical protein
MHCCGRGGKNLRNGKRKSSVGNDMYKCMIGWSTTKCANFSLCFTLQYSKSRKFYRIQNRGYICSTSIDDVHCSLPALSNSGQFLSLAWSFHIYASTTPAGTPCGQATFCGFCFLFLCLFYGPHIIVVNFLFSPTAHVDCGLCGLAHLPKALGKITAIHAISTHTVMVY